MQFLKRLFRKNSGFFAHRDKVLAYLYEHPETLVELEFSNKSGSIKRIWVEPTCLEIELVADTEYRIVSHDRLFHFAFDDAETLIVYLQMSFGCRLYKRPAGGSSKKSADWELLDDSHDIG